MKTASDLQFKTGDIIKAKVTSMPNIIHSGIVVVSEGKVMIAHNTPSRKNSSGGNIVAEQSFDAWGRRTVTGTPLAWLYRGYTGHEHLDEFGLINMNGRMYDPIVGRMLSPDNYVVNPFGTQAYNRYSYVFNNPLSYVDPDGNEPVTIALIITGAVLGGYFGGALASDNWNPVSKQYWQDGWQGFTAGAVIGAALGGATGMTIGAKGLAGLAGAQKAFVTGTYSGMINMLSSYDSEQGGLASLAYFGAGFAGGYGSAAMGKVAGLFVGNVTNCHLPLKK